MHSDNNYTAGSTKEQDSPDGRGSESHGEAAEPMNGGHGKENEKRRRNRWVSDKALELSELIYYGGSFLFRSRSRSTEVEEHRRTKEKGKKRDRSRSRDRKMEGGKKDRDREKTRKRSPSREKRRRSKSPKDKRRPPSRERRRSRDRTNRRRSRSPARRRRSMSPRPYRRGRTPPNGVRNRSPAEEITAEERDARTVFCMQLSQRIRARDLDEFFSSVGKVRDVRLITCNKTKRFKGIAYIEFKDPESVSLVSRGEKWGVLF